MRGGMPVLTSLLLASLHPRSLMGAPQLPTPHRPPRYRIDLEAAPKERWQGLLDDVLAKEGTAPFFEYYTVLMELLRKHYPTDLRYYERHIRDFQDAYAAVAPDALADVHALADALSARAATQAERELFARDQVLLIQLHMQIGNIGVPQRGECTSIVVRRPDGSLAHFRNWDFGPVGQALGALSVEVDFVFGSTGRQGFRCLLALTHIDKWTTCMKPGAFSMSLNARGFGDGHERGRSPETELALFRAGRLPRIAVLRKVMLAPSYHQAVEVAASAKALTSLYVILAGRGSLAANGAVVTIEGNGTRNDVLRLPAPADGWFLVQTNVDHWLPMAQSSYSSHRREHVKAALRELGPEAPLWSLYQVLQDTHVYPAGNTGPDDGRIFRSTTIASVLMQPLSDPASAEAWWADVWRGNSSASRPDSEPHEGELILFS